MIQRVTKFLKKKVEEWVEWHPQFLELSLDYRLFTPKKKAIEGLSQFWINYETELAEEREERKQVAQSVHDRIKAIKERQAKNTGRNAVNSFTIMVNSPADGEQGESE